ncbi:MAG: hypothetical protein EAZ78_25180 [Oscillatoriales cyanobacterium]|nr:MAG: hypothetical protein EA000_25950 [Oscillatoriales cyanobacterium]TAD93199.1 MAG: hypothetical protein EAZ98_23690 [Oscillatoriales cyanobacterium]TAE06050.1 MAG: hypothetical protein EAZ96_03620 [Oscillatoriales cyanobacterium]TAE97855.1 MAG: hypothetical protein EAZ78_25180 [Oscillatoriales cyanobacterium]TAF36271.1 MAG: hypothetical protein EAZ68_17005 [Oscillatoriales cyanobacterium]
MTRRKKWEEEILLVTRLWPGNAYREALPPCWSLVMPIARKADFSIFLFRGRARVIWVPRLEPGNQL